MRARPHPRLHPGLALSLNLSVGMLLALPAPAAHAWGAEGHSIVAEIAQRRLDPAASAGVTAALGPQVSLASIASWADGQRAEHPQTGNWHFVDIPLASEHYDAQRDCAPDPARGDCIVRALERLRTQVACAATLPERRDALRYAVHFVGDLHQPLHTVGEKMGGNQFAVHGSIQGRTCRHHCELGPDSANLHALWDTTLIRRTVWDWGAYVTRLEDGLLQSATLRAQAVAGGPEQWALQTHAVARAVWNDTVLPADGTLGEAYYETVLPLLDQQLALAGLRLAAFLNAAYAPGACQKPAG